MLHKYFRTTDYKHWYLDWSPWHAISVHISKASEQQRCYINNTKI